jgi:hypothetical protein
VSAARGWLAAAVGAIAVTVALPAGWAAAERTSTAAADEAPAPSLVITSVRVSPPRPGPGTLCQLHVTLRNDGASTASELGFRVTVGGVELPAYRNRLFMARVEPGAGRELRLYNFWTTEAGRPAPPDGRYRIEVALQRARWYSVAGEGGDEVWTPTGEVPGLPSVSAVTTGG